MISLNTPKADIHTNISSISGRDAATNQETGFTLLAKHYTLKLEELKENAYENESANLGPDYFWPHGPTLEILQKELLEIHGLLAKIWKLSTSHFNFETKQECFRVQKL
ncbi:hypothetical protein TNCV_3703761 [Trichonephila clavipes]|nr:hypothetical protein TNCV_3703761 [Trichonephila clavipes]